MRTPTILALVAAALALSGAALAADAHIDTKGAVRADASVSASAPAAPSPSAPPVPMPMPVPADGASDVLELASAHTGVTTPRDAPVSVGASADASAKASPQAGSPGEAIAHAVVPAVERAGPPVVATAGAIAILHVLGVWRFLALGAMGLYSRLTKSDMLDNEHRDRVYKLIQETPGLGVTEVAALTGLGWGTTVYHLDRLERAGFVAAEKGGLHKCYFPVGTVAREARKGIGALKADTTRSVAEMLLSRPGLTQTELCEALSLSPSAASKQVSKLEGAGLVRRERDWKTVHLHPTDALPALLAPNAGVPVAAAPVAALMPA